MTDRLGASKGGGNSDAAVDIDVVNNDDNVGVVSLRKSVSVDGLKFWLWSLRSWSWKEDREMTPPEEQTEEKADEPKAKRGRMASGVPEVGGLAAETAPS